MAEPGPNGARVRLRYAKHGKVRFTSHRDAVRLWERALRRTALPVASSHGFTPRPRLSFGLALPTGGESVAEYLDVELEAAVDVDALPATLTAALPAGIDVLAAREIDVAAGSLQHDVTSVTWELSAPWLTPAHHADAARRLLGATALPIERERKGMRQHDDVRGVVIDLRCDATRNRLVADLATVGRALRPAELAQLAYRHCDPVSEPHIAVRALRTHQWIEHDGARREVIPLPADVRALAAAVGA